MSRPDCRVASTDNADRGRDVELEAAERFPLVLADDEDAPNWYDAVLVDDVAELSPATPVEVKGCVDRLETQPRRGRWWVRRDNHEQLLENAGAYALAVYDDDGDVQRFALIPATWVDHMLDGRWTPCGDRVPGQDESAQLPWSSLFDDLEEPGGVAGGD